MERSARIDEEERENRRGDRGHRHRGHSVEGDTRGREKRREGPRGETSRGERGRLERREREAREERGEAREGRQGAAGGERRPARRQPAATLHHLTSPSHGRCSLAGAAGQGSVTSSKSGVLRRSCLLKPAAEMQPSAPR